VQHDFTDKTVLITGGSRGQGAAEARLFAQNRARVIVGDVVKDEGEALAEEIRATGGQCAFRKLDVANEKDWDEAATFAKDKFGGLDVLVNNAGVSLRGVDIAHTTREQWDRARRQLDRLLPRHPRGSAVDESRGRRRDRQYRLDRRHQRPFRRRL
jgi:NAD(P)-dependent dehydrogenase (short-subunit alcohol dehydrogenase family)